MLPPSMTRHGLVIASPSPEDAVANNLDDARFAGRRNVLARCKFTSWLSMLLDTSIASAILRSTTVLAEAENADSVNPRTATH